MALLYLRRTAVRRSLTASPFYSALPRPGRLTGFFATGVSTEKGVFYGGGFHFLGVQTLGVLCTDFAPSADAFQKEAQKRIQELHMYDVLRADRCISFNSLEARVPFGDLDFVKYVMAIDPEMKLKTWNMTMPALLPKSPCSTGNCLKITIQIRAK